MLPNLHSSLSPAVTKARDFARGAHGAQRYGEHPYLDHLDHVAAVLEALGLATERRLVLAYLHDVLEDTAVSKEELAEVFGGQVASGVFLVTLPEGGSHRERVERFYALWGAFSPSAITWVERDAAVVKVCDRIANCEASRIDNPKKLTAYRNQHARFREVFFGFLPNTAVWRHLDALLDWWEPWVKK